MTHVMRESVIKITMSPLELRQMADKMDERWKKLRLGETTFVDFLGYENGGLTRIELHLDQTYYHDLAKRSPV